ncbi:hypothetical protein [Metapseudomonas otitidis]|uniref:hypothetical protein n=1 Tax=Metapseudomonas otitidis TaxID=319939 RepID=UPI00197D7615|nr:hypothetical protein [Pseudomonas otitidis]
MLLRTITVENGQREAFNAAVLCSLTIPEIEGNVLVYTLNEAAPQGTSWVYLAALVPLVEGGYQLSSLDDRACQVARQVLRQIVGGARSANRDAAAAYHFIRIERLGPPLTPHPTCLEQHHPLSLGPGAIQTLLACRSSDKVGEPFYSRHLLPYQPYESPLEDAPVATVEPQQAAVAPASAPHSVSRSEQMLREVQATLNTLVDMAGIFTGNQQDGGHPHPNHKLAEREHQLQAREARLQALEAQLHARQNEQEQRCKRLTEHEAALDRRAAELDVQVEKLLAAKERLRRLMRTVNENVHVGNTLGTIGNALPVVDD